MTENINIHEKVYTALGAASMCWKPQPSSQVFQSYEAHEIGDKLISDILEFAEESNKELRAKIGSQEIDLEMISGTVQELEAVAMAERIIRKVAGEDHETAIMAKDEVISELKEAAKIKDEWILELKSKLEVAVDILEDAQLQLGYLNEKFKPTGTSNNLIARIESILTKINN